MEASMEAKSAVGLGCMRGPQRLLFSKSAVVKRGVRETERV